MQQIHFDVAHSRQSLDGLWAHFLQEARARNELYYLINLMEGWSQGPHTDYGMSVNKLVQTLLLDRMSDGNARMDSPHSILYLLQACLENKHYYAVVRNFVSLLSGRAVAPLPWSMAHGEYTVRKDGKAQISTGAILRGIEADLRLTGHAGLADEWKDTHIAGITPIRNALAHATFVVPERPGQEWVFGEYRSDASSGLSIVETRMSDADFLALCKRFFDLRMSSLHAIGAASRAVENRQFDFVAANQFDQREQLQCRFDCGQLRITVGKTPL